jgi:hypothetical protein
MWNRGGYHFRAVSCSFNVKETEVVTFQTFNKEAVSAKVYTGLTPLIIKV